ncbi:MAG TPA: homocysteine S-methyltransferase [Terracidiphilus sp.]
MASAITNNSILDGLHVLDGGFATELEFQGAKIDGPLWSAHVLEDAPEKIIATHRAFIQAGSEIIATASYQVSRRGYIEYGLTAQQADRALLRAVELARAAAAEFPARRVLIGASLGPYGAILHNGAEYHGNYDLSFADLVSFHRERIAILAESHGAQAPDLLAFETFPSLIEAQAVAEAMAPWPHLSAWFSFACKDALHIAHGEPLRDCARFLAGVPQTAAIGVNCTPPALMVSLIAELKAASDKPILVYPNSGEGWDAVNRCWIGSTDSASFGSFASEWFAAGAQMVGGCCRTRPDHIRQVAAAVV